MRITCHVTPKAKANRVTQVNSRRFRVATTAPADNNKANIAAEKLLAQYFGVKQSEVFLLSGRTSRMKVFEVLL